MEAVKNSLDCLSDMFLKRMAEFESDLQKTSQPKTSNTGTVAAEFTAFKDFIMKALYQLQNQIQLLAQDVDRMEMRSRYKMLLLHGVPEERAENLSVAVSKISVDKLKINGFSSNDIERCHRMGQSPTSGRPRPILIKFSSPGIRDKMWAAKTSLKGSGYTLSEFLTKTRHTTFVKARERFGVTNCWTRDGFICVLAPDGSRHRIAYMRELDKIPQPDTAKPPVVIDATGPPRSRRAVASKK